MKTFNALLGPVDFSPNTETAVYYYDSAGNRTKRVAATGAVAQYTYDVLDRVLT